MAVQTRSKHDLAWKIPWDGSYRPPINDVEDRPDRVSDGGLVRIGVLAEHESDNGDL